MPRRFQVAVILDAWSCNDRKILAGIATYVNEMGRPWSFYVEGDGRQKIPDLRSWRGDGVIANLQDRKVALAVQRLDVPVVEVGGGCGWYEPASKIPCFATDSAAIARLAAEHLLDHGFRHLAYCGFPRTRHNPWSEERGLSFKRRARAAGCPCSVFTGRYETARKWEHLQRGLMTWLQTLEMPVGLMACNDVRARHVLEACRTLGLRVPEDVAVIGVDNDEVLCELTDPPLSSIEPGMQRLGYQAAALLDQEMQGTKTEQKRFVVEPEGVVARRSTDTLAISNAEVVRAARFIREHACQGIRIADLAKAVGLSRSMIERKFKALMGRTLHAEIDRVRIDCARRLLAETELPLKQVAAQAGFKYVQYLSTVFRRRFDQTPREYRLRARMPVGQNRPREMPPPR